MKKNKKLHLALQFFSGSKRYFAVVVCSSLVTTALNACTPQLFRYGVDSVLGDGTSTYISDHLWIPAAAIILFSILSGVSTYIGHINTAKAGENFAKNMKDYLFRHIQRLPMSWHDSSQTGDIIQRCTSDVEVIRSFVVTQLLEVFRTVFLVAVSFAMMLSISAKLSLITLVFIPLVIVYTTVFYRMIARNFIVADEAEGELSTIVQENATGVRVVRAFGREQYEMDRFREKNAVYAKLWIHVGTVSGLYWGVGDLITGLQVVLVIVFGALEALHGNITVGGFIAFASYNTTLVWPVRGLGRIFTQMSKAGVSFDRINYIIDAAEEDYAEGSTSSAAEKQTAAAGTEDVFERNNVYCIQDTSSPADHSICFRDVSFRYDTGEEVLSHVDLSIPSGCTLGILGGTGSGKSTLVHLLCRLYELKPGQGRILLGGKDIRDIPLETLRRQIGIVLQEPFLYSRTIRENISLARPSASLEEIREAARIACIDDTVMNFPDGYDTLVGEKGVTLSGGQRQRVAIARMLLQKSPVMIFDDSLSAVDSETDLNIRRALKEKMKDATVILISHRITTLMNADLIMVLNHGQTAELGTHDELIRSGGIYQQIYDLQTEEEVE